MRYIKPHLLIIWLIAATLIIVGCQQEPPTPDFVLPSPSNTAPPPTAIPTRTTRPTPTPRIRRTPTPTATPNPTQTPIPQVVIEVLSSEDEQPLSGASVRLSQLEQGYDATFLTLDDGTAHFVGVIPSDTPYLVEVGLVSFQPVSMELVVVEGINELTLQLERGVTAEITTQTVNLRAGPGLGFDVVVEVSQGQIFPVIGVSVDLEWVQVLTPDGLEGWVFASLVEIEGDLSQFEGVETTAPPPPAQTPTSTTDDAATPDATAESGDSTITPTPAPLRPPRIVFNAEALYDDMISLQTAMVQLRGVLDRRTPGVRIESEEYIGYYQQLITIQTYRNVPDDWTRIHNLYVNSAGNTLDTNRAIYLQCLEGGGLISPFNFRNARNGVDFSLERLRIGIIAAEERLAV